MGVEGCGVSGGEARGPSWGGGGGGEKEGWSRVVKFLNSPERPKQVELSSFIHLLLHPPTVWALDLPKIHPVKVTRGLVCITSYCILKLLTHFKNAY
jgi:hypothetical protein